MKLKETAIPAAKAAILACCALVDWLHRRHRSAFLGLGRMIGDLIFHFVRKRRTVVMANIRATVGRDWGPERTRAVAREVYRNLALNLLEFMTLPFMTRDRINSIVRPHGLDVFLKHSSDGRGSILLTAHVGNWEYLGAWLGLNGYPINAVNKKQKGIFADIVSEFRETVGMKLVFKGSLLKAAVNCLKQGEILGLLADQGAGRVVDFLGRRTSMPYGAAMFSRKFGAPVIPTFSVRLHDGTHRAFCLPEVEMTRTGDAEADFLENTRRISRVLGEVITRHPEHWFWLHKMWKDLAHTAETGAASASWQSARAETGWQAGGVGPSSGEAEETE